MAEAAMLPAPVPQSSRARRLLPAADLSGPLPARAPAARQLIEAHGLRVVHLASLAQIAPEQWNALFPGLAENWGYFRGIELARSEHFTYSALLVYDADRLIAAAPLFRLDYRLDTTLGAGMKGVGDWLARHLPRLVKLPVLGIGSPMTEQCPIGLAPDLDEEARRHAVAALLAGLDAHAEAEHIKVLALKDVSNHDARHTDDTLRAAGFTRMASLPVATLALPFATFEDYLKSMTSRHRSEFRSKLKRAGDIAVEFRDDIGDVYDEIIALYRATRDNRKQSYEAFDEVPETYFREVMRQSSGQARVMLCRIDGRLVSFSFFLVEKDRVIGKLLGMDYSIARERNLYFFNILAVIRYCIEHGIPELQTGQTSYAVKLRFGCKLERSWVYFKHRGIVLGALFRAIGPRLSFDAIDPDLAKLGDKAVYLEA